MQKIGPNGDGKSAVATPDGKSRKKKIVARIKSIYLSTMGARLEVDCFAGRD